MITNCIKFKLLWDREKPRGYFHLLGNAFSLWGRWGSQATISRLHSEHRAGNQESGSANYLHNEDACSCYGFGKGEFLGQGSFSSAVALEVGWALLLFASLNLFHLCFISWFPSYHVLLYVTPNLAHILASSMILMNGVITDRRMLLSSEL